MKRYRSEEDDKAIELSRVAKEDTADLFQVLAEQALHGPRATKVKP